MPLVRRSCWSLLLLLASGLLDPLSAVPAAIAPPDRRQRVTPGLVLETGARHAACDALFFTRDGHTLLAAGDDKVVRSWHLDASGFSDHRSRNLRWPIYREQKGSIYAVALSPDPEQSRVAIAGCGLEVGFVAILDRKTGQPTHTLGNVTSDQAVWKVAFAPSGKQLIYGADDGSLFVWDFAAGRKESTHLRDSGGGKLNRVRLLSFLDQTRFVSVAQDGRILVRDLHNLQAPPRQLGQFKLPRLFRVSISPNRQWLAATGEYVPGGRAEGKGGDFHTVELFSLTGPGQRILRLPAPPQGRTIVPRSLAFDPAGERLAVGVIHFQKPNATFYKELAGHVHLFEVASGRLLPTDLDLGYRPEVLAFRPGAPTQLATAGGNNHEVRLWDVSGKGRLLDTIQSPGACLWSVGISQDNRYLAFRDQRNPDPPHPNEWGTGPWRVFDLQGKPPRIRSRPPAGFSPVLPRTQEAGWHVRFHPSNAYLWEVVAPDGRATPLDAAHGLYDPDVNNMPRCYTFLPAGHGKPVRLAVGHTWGVSLYDCRPGNVRLARYMLGHEADVMAIAPSADGRLLLSASRDQTIAGWSVKDWPSHPEFGASFVSGNNKLRVLEVDPGSPAWELGLTDGDEITLLVVTSARAVYNTTGKPLQEFGIKLPGARSIKVDQALAELKAARPNQEMIFQWRTPRGELKAEKTTVKQRPLWRFFPTRTEKGNEWLIWRWRDYYYDTNSPQADSWCGWHLNTGNQGLDGKPEFYRLERLRSRFHNPVKIWRTVREGIYRPDKVLFADIEPPEVQVSAVGGSELRGAELVLKVAIRPRSNQPGQKVERALLWLDDYRLPDFPQPDRTGTLVQEVRIPRAKLRRGINHLTLQGFNVAGGRGQATLEINNLAPQQPTKPILHALCVGINDYSHVKGDFADPSSLNLVCPRSDATAVAELLKKQAGGMLYAKADVVVLEDARATAANILGHLKELKKRNLSRNDWLVLYLSGHGFADRVEADSEKRRPDTFFFLCADTDSRKPETKLRGLRLTRELSELPCYKLIVLDACHSGSVTSNPVRALTPEGIPFLVFSSCHADQQSLEPKKPPHPILGRHGLFTRCLLEAVEKSSSRVVTTVEMSRSIDRQLAELLREVNKLSSRQEKHEQTPVFYPDPLPRLPVLARP
jgi:WD40 repeat protein